MKTGWVLLVSDMHAKDRAFKTIQKTRSEASEKVVALTKKYEEIEEGRFKVTLTSPHCELDIEKRVKLKCRLSEEMNAAMAMSYFYDRNPFCYATDDAFAFIEVNAFEESELEGCPMQVDVISPMT